MPNWCENTLIINGKEKDIKEFKEKVKEGENVLSNEKLFPRPKELKGEGWYNWSIQNWGTKWGICEPTILNETKTQIRYAFDTAWSPPERMFLKVSKDYPKLKFTLRFWEGGMCFKGVFQVKNGEILKDETSEYNGGRGG